VGQRLRVLFYTENYTVGGCDRFLADLVRNLDPEAFDTSLAGSLNPAFDRWLAARLPEHLPRHEVAVSTLPNSRLVQRVERWTRRLDQRDGQPFESADSRGIAMRVGAAALRYEQAVPNYVRLRRLFRRLYPDVLHINNGGYPGGETCRLAALAARAEGVRGVVHFVHSTASEPSFPAQIEQALDRRIDQATDVWLTAADRAGAALHERRSISRDRIETVHYGIEAADGIKRHRPQNPNDRPVIAVVASFDPGKGHAVLVDALATLKRDGFRATTLLIGEGPERAAIERRSAEAGVTEDVRFLGWRNDVDELLAKSDLLVLPSIAYECLPYSILEGMSHRLPVVATDLAGIPEEVIDGVTGRVVPPADANALAEAIRDVASDPSRARQMGERAKERVSTVFGLELMVARMSEIYRRVAAASGS
jgi:glycosyltransferase involved in cell wall biosynthesis